VLLGKKNVISIGSIIIIIVVWSLKTLNGRWHQSIVFRLPGERKGKG